MIREATKYILICRESRSRQRGSEGVALRTQKIYLPSRKSESRLDALTNSCADLQGGERNNRWSWNELRRYLRRLILMDVFGVLLSLANFFNL